MIIGAIILGIFIFVLFILAVYASKKYGDNFDDDKGFVGIILAALIILETALIADIIYGARPSAINVYQGKTNIEYTIRDGVKVDSVVVFKDNYDEK